jgi:hypothetical protein
MLSSGASGSLLPCAASLPHEKGLNILSEEAGAGDALGCAWRARVGALPPLLATGRVAAAGTSRAESGDAIDDVSDVPASEAPLERHRRNALPGGHGREGGMPGLGERGEGLCGPLTSCHTG